MSIQGLSFPDLQMILLKLGGYFLGEPIQIWLCRKSWPGLSSTWLCRNHSRFQIPGMWCNENLYEVGGNRRGETTILQRMHINNPRIPEYSAQQGVACGVIQEWERGKCDFYLRQKRVHLKQKRKEKKNAIRYSIAQILHAWVPNQYLRYSVFTEMDLHNSHKMHT